MNLNELKKKYEDLGNEIKRLESKGPWKPEAGEKYYSLDFIGKIVNNLLWNYDTIDSGLYARGRVFRTKEEAQAWSDDELAYYELLRAAQVINDGWVPDWSGDDTLKFSFFYNHSGKMWEKIAVLYPVYPGCIYFETSEKRDQFLTENKDKLDVLLRWPR